MTGKLGCDTVEEDEVHEVFGIMTRADQDPAQTSCCVDKCSVDLHKQGSGVGMG
jgi:hypothetical protein